MRKMYAMIGLLFGMVLLMSNSGCDSKPNTNDVLAEKQENLMKEANAQVGMPAISQFTERKMMKMILELRDKPNLILYAYIVPEMTGKPVFLGKCIGYGLPYSTQYTNPEVASEHTDAYGGNYTMPQADPNGLFMPEAAEGTWLMLIDPETNEAKPIYCEPRLLISPFKLPV
jgi:hypothetical protein